MECQSGLHLIIRESWGFESLRRNLKGMAVSERINIGEEAFILALMGFDEDPDKPVKIESPVVEPPVSYPIGTRSRRRLKFAHWADKDVEYWDQPSKSSFK